jgi:hypothetical protein
VTLPVAISEPSSAPELAASAIDSAYSACRASANSAASRAVSAWSRPAARSMITSPAPRPASYAARAMPSPPGPAAVQCRPIPSRHETYRLLPQACPGRRRAGWSPAGETTSSPGDFRDWSRETGPGRRKLHRLRPPPPRSSGCANVLLAMP